MDCEGKHAAQPTPVQGLQLPRKMLNSITAAVAKQEAGRDCSQFAGAMSPRSKSRLCSQFHMNVEKRHKTDCWSPCKAVMLQWRPWATQRADPAPSLPSVGAQLSGGKHTQ